MNMQMMSHVKVRTSTTHHILLAKFQELPIEIYALKLTIGFQHGSLIYPPLLVSQ